MTVEFGFYMNLESYHSRLSDEELKEVWNKAQDISPMELDHSMFWSHQGIELPQGIYFSDINQAQETDDAIREMLIEYMNPKDKEMAQIDKSAIEIDELKPNTSISRQVEQGREYAVKLYNALRKLGFEDAERHSVCSVATFESHLEKGGKRVEIISSSFMGVFTIINVG